MKSMSLAESAVLLGLHTIGMSLLILCCVIITILAFCASKCDSCTHNFTSVYAGLCRTNGRFTAIAAFF